MVIHVHGLKQTIPPLSLLVLVTFYNWTTSATKFNETASLYLELARRKAWQFVGIGLCSLLRDQDIFQDFV